VIEFHDANGKMLLSQDYSSADRQSGLVLEQCRWTPDSRFFVYSAYSSGGHQPWHSPTLFHDRTANKIYRLDDLLGPITAADFDLKAPDILESMGQVKVAGAVHYVRKDDPDEPDVVFDVSLSQLLAGGPASGPAP
jgi:hypothetical protein